VVDTSDDFVDHKPVISSVDGSWERILAWLARESPATLERVGPPATTAEIDVAREAMGGHLPTDLVAWWRLANGSASSWSDQGFDLLPIYRPCRIDHALSSRDVWLHVWHDQAIEQGWLTEEILTQAEAKPAGTQAGTWLAGFLPIATSGAGADLFVDLRSGPMHGCVRVFDRVSTDGEPRWAGVAAMLADIADALENHDPIDDYHACLDHEGILYWEL
jgi:cell wall assembly regulator SMI1